MSEAIPLLLIYAFMVWTERTSPLHLEWLWKVVMSFHFILLYHLLKPLCNSAFCCYRPRGSGVSLNSYTLFLSLLTRAWNLYSAENCNVLQHPITPVVPGLAIRGILCAVVSGCRHVDCASHLCHVVPRWRIHSTYTYVGFWGSICSSFNLTN